MRKKLHKLWRIISNITTIQQIIQWIGIPKIISAGGTLAVMIYSVFQHTPTPQIIIISIATFAAILWVNIGIVHVLNWRKQRLVDSKTKSTQTESSIKTSNDVGWWVALADGDRKDIKHRVPLVYAQVGIESVKKTGYCCVHFMFVFINATVYKVIVRQVNGDIYADGMKLPNKLAINMKENRLVFPHGVGFALRCSLLINEPYLQELIKLSGKKVQFGLERINIMADLIDPADKKASEFRLEIPHRVTLDVPDLATDHQLELRKVDLSTE